ncbi:hypothetical protein [Microcoleus sp. S13C4]|uniref:hypothetical protein n=1 Tax=Microcoleus sp. S13C4 TaxID=3055410 RepID=UPI002FD4018D
MLPDSNGQAIGAIDPIVVLGCRKPDTVLRSPLSIVPYLNRTYALKGVKSALLNQGMNAPGMGIS